jgi:hypothetical protein
MPSEAPMIYSVILPERAVVASSVQQFALGVNPVAAIDVMLTGTWSGASNTLGPATILSHFASFRITRKGAAMIDVIARDAPFVGLMIADFTPFYQAGANVAGSRFALGFRMPFTTRPGDPEQCLPAVNRGDLLFEYTSNALPGTISALNISLMQMEVPGINPTNFIRTTTLQRTPTATGDLDVDMPGGGLMIGASLFGTTVPNAGANTKTINTARILFNNEEEQIVSSTWEHLAMLAIQRGGDIPSLIDHVHIENSAAAYTQNVITNGPQNQVSTFANYAYLDLDPTRDGRFALDLRNDGTNRGLGQIRLNCGDTQPLRVIPHMQLDADLLN